MAKKALGRGLSNLLPGAASGDKTIVRDNPNYQEIALNEIKPNPNQPRKQFDPQDLNELAATLHSVGLIEPVVVRRLTDGSGYQLISGERRWRAARLAGFKKLPAVIKQVNDIQALEMGIIENIQREELSPIEEARAYDYWMQQTGQKASDIANRVGKDRTTITNLLRLLKLPDEALELVDKGMLTPGQARPLLGVGDRKMLARLSARIVREGWSARRVEDEVARLTSGTRSGSTGSGKTSGSRRDPNIANLEKKIRTRLTAKVQVAHKKNGAGSITIHYNNLDDLDRLLEAMKVK